MLNFLINYIISYIILSIKKFIEYDTILTQSMKSLTKDEIKISVFSKLEKELKKIGIKVAESYISTDRDYGYIKGIPEKSYDEIDITVEVCSDPDNTSHKPLSTLRSETMKLTQIKV